MVCAPRISLAGAPQSRRASAAGAVGGAPTLNRRCAALLAPPAIPAAGVATTQLSVSRESVVGALPLPLSLQTARLVDDRLGGRIMHGQHRAFDASSKMFL